MSRAATSTLTRATAFERKGLSRADSCHAGQPAAASKITLITATFNSARTLSACLASVRAQGASGLEHIVIDGGSRDGTLEVLDAHRDQISTLVSEPDNGIYEALNKGLARATGEVVGFLHADDEWADARVFQRISTAFEDPEVEAVYGDLLYVDAANPARVRRRWRAGRYSPARLALGWMPPHPTFFVRRRLYQRAGFFDPSYRIAGDYESMLRLLGAMQGRIEYIPEVLVRMRLGGTSNRSLRNLLVKSMEDYRALRSTGVGGVGALAWKNLSKLPQWLRR